MPERDDEADRRDALREAASDRDMSDAELAEAFAPGTLGCHEAMHTAFVSATMVGEHLSNHPAVLLQPEWYALATRAESALADLYQAIGERHLPEEP